MCQTLGRKKEALPWPKLLLTVTRVTRVSQEKVAVPVNQ